MIIFFAVGMGILLLAVVLSPFWLGPGGALESGAAHDDPVKIEAIKKAFLKRFLQEEQAFKDGLISEMTWNKRKQFITGRYIDLSRRADFLSFEKNRKGQGT